MGFIYTGKSKEGVEIAISTLQNLNYRKMKPRDLINKIREAMSHIEFALYMCAAQAKASSEAAVADFVTDMDNWTSELQRRASAVVTKARPRPNGEMLPCALEKLLACLCR